MVPVSVRWFGGETVVICGVRVNMRPRRTQMKINQRQGRAVPAVKLSLLRCAMKWTFSSVNPSEEPGAANNSHALAHRPSKFPTMCVRGDDPQHSNRKWGQFFYKMASGVRPQWIRTFPVLEAPHTGDGLFEGEVIEVVQVSFLTLWGQGRRCGRGQVVLGISVTRLCCGQRVVM